MSMIYHRSTFFKIRIGHKYLNPLKPRYTLNFLRLLQILTNFIQFSILRHKYRGCKSCICYIIHVQIRFNSTFI